MLKTIILSIAILFILILLPTNQAYAAAGVGRVVHAYGPTWIQRGAKREKIEKGLVVLRNDSIITGSRGRVKIIMGDGSKVYVGAKSRISLRKYSLKGTRLLNATIHMFWGKARFFVSKLTDRKSSFRVRTSTAVLGVRGTEFIVLVPPTPKLLENPFANVTLSDIGKLPTRTVLIEGAVDIGAFNADGDTPTIRMTPGKTVDVGKEGEVKLRKTEAGDIEKFVEQHKHKKAPKQEVQKEFKKYLPPPPRIDVPEQLIIPDAPVELPTIDPTDAINAIQNFETTTEIKIQPSFVEP